MTGLAEIQKDHEEHREGYANLFTQMEVYSNYFGKYLESYEPILEEISRRSFSHQNIAILEFASSKSPSVTYILIF